jgi:site-specific DNA-methyltransferase (adenine-specific)
MTNWQDEFIKGNEDRLFYREDGGLMFCSDCLEVMKGWPDGCVDLVLTDPPYNIGYGYDGYKDNLTEEAYIELLATFQYPFKTVMIHYPEETMQYLVPALGPPDKVIAWCYNSHCPRRFRLISFWNVLPCFEKVTQPFKNPNDKRIVKKQNAGVAGCPVYDWWADIQQVKNVSLEKTEHPCPVPLRLMNRILKISSTEHDIILDPFCGSGTTCVAAKKLGRRYIGIEISEDYCQISKDRLISLDTGVPVKEMRAGQGALFND